MFKGILQIKEKDSITTRIWERIRADKQMRMGEELKHYKNNKMRRSSIYLSIITLNINGLNFPIKRHRLADWI
jgi:hypothetical protein